MPKYPRLKNAKSQPFPFWIVGFVVIIIAIGAATFLGGQSVSAEFNRPLGPTLVPFAAATPVIAIRPASDMVSNPGGTPVGYATSTAGPTLALPQSAAQCNGPRQLMLLVVGTDHYEGISGLSDVIRVVRFDFSAPSISVLALPRDLWVLIPNLPESGQINLQKFFGDVVNPDGTPMLPPGSYGKLNVAYFYGNLYNLPGGGASSLAGTIYTNFGVSIDHYLIINMKAFEETVDSVGGVDVDVDKAMTDKDKGWHFEPGPQHMDGEHALQYARIRENDSDFGRMSRQSVLAMALRDRLLMPENLQQASNIVSRVMGDIRTDLSRAEISSIACLITVVPHDFVRSYQVTGKMVRGIRTTRNSSVLLPDPTQIGALIYEFLYGPTQ